MIVVVHNRTAEFYQSKQVCIKVNWVVEFMLKTEWYVAKVVIFFKRLSFLSKLFGSLNFILVFDKKDKHFKFVLNWKKLSLSGHKDIYSFFEQT